MYSRLHRNLIYLERCQSDLAIRDHFTQNEVTRIVVCKSQKETFLAVYVRLRVAPENKKGGNKAIS